MSKKRLLVIEDDVDVSEMLTVYFASQGYEVFHAMSGQEGIGMARAKFPNLILLDVMLPDMDGFDVCKALRTTTLTKYIPITFLTQRDRRSDKVAGLELGVDDYVTKPFDVEELRLRIQGSIRRSNREVLQDPRTGLPTKTLTEATKAQLIVRPNCAQLDIRVIGYDDFRDIYGFVAGDDILAFLGHVLTETITTHGTVEDFAGTYSDDRYVVFTFAYDVSAFSAALQTRFNEGARRFYNFADTDRGYILVNEAHDDERHIPLMHFLISQITSAQKIGSV